MRSFGMILGTTLLLAGARLQSQAPCLPYEPDSVQLSGRLIRRTDPGPPNYESIADGDTAETYFYLVLATPICTRAGSDSSSNAALDGVTLIQLNLDPAGFAVLRSSLGRTITLRGTLYQGFSGHHHAPLVMSVPRPKPLP